MASFKIDTAGDPISIVNFTGDVAYIGRGTSKKKYIPIKANGVFKFFYPLGEGTMYIKNFKNKNMSLSRHKLENETRYILKEISPKDKVIQLS